MINHTNTSFERMYASGSPKLKSPARSNGTRECNFHSGRVAREKVYNIRRTRIALRVVKEKKRAKGQSKAHQRL